MGPYKVLNPRVRNKTISSVASAICDQIQMSVRARCDTQGHYVQWQNKTKYYFDVSSSEDYEYAAAKARRQCRAVHARCAKHKRRSNETNGYTQIHRQSWSIRRGEDIEGLYIEIPEGRRFYYETGEERQALDHAMHVHYND